MGSVQAVDMLAAADKLIAAGNQPAVDPRRPM
jgi:hypothetical protein